MKNEDKNWEFARIHEPIEELPPTHFTEPMNGECVHCVLPKEYGSAPGLVKIKRDINDMKVVADGAWCLYCGQHYMIRPENLEKFMGHSADAMFVKYQWWSENSVWVKWETTTGSKVSFDLDGETLQINKGW